MNLKIKARGIILKNNKIFLVEDSRCNKFMLPGGTLDEGENILGTLKREIFEELGIEPVVDNVLYVREFLTFDNQKGIEFCFLIKNVDDFDFIDKSKCSHSDEWYTAKFYDINELDNIDVHPKNLKELILNSINEKQIYLSDL